MSNQVAVGAEQNTAQQTQQVKDSLLEVSLELGDFDRAQTNAYSWLSIFSTTGDGMRDRVHSYGSEQEVIDDTLRNLHMMTGITGADYVAQTMAQRIAAQVDFNKHDFVVVSLSDGGPPFGHLDIKKTVTGYSFCIQRPQPEPLMSGRALKSFLKFYAVAKGQSVSHCLR